MNISHELIFWLICLIKGLNILPDTLVMTKYILFLVLSFLLNSAAQSTPQEFSSEAKVAILVGVDKYNEQITGVRPLRYAVNDMVKLADTLKKQKYTVIPIYDASASKNVILHKIRQVGQFMKPGEGTLLFAFSGHGFSPDGKVTSLVTNDTIVSNLKGTGLSIPELIREIRKVNPKKAVLFLDACRNDPSPGARSATKAGFVNLNPGQGIQILYSTKQAEKSFEEPSFKQGIFSYFLNRGLSGEAFINNNVTFRGISDYVEHNVSKWTLENKAKVQKPFRSTYGDVAGSFVLATNGIIPPPPRSDKDITPQPNPNPFGRNRQTSGFANLIRLSYGISDLPRDKPKKVHYCRLYSHVSASQARADLNRNCGFGQKNSNRWSVDAGPQYFWCTTVDPSRTRGEAELREKLLEVSCR